MITALTGDNSFAIRDELTKLINQFSGSAERIDGTSLEVRQLPDLLMGGTLFASERLVIIRELSQNSVIWPVFSDWLERVADTTHLVLVDEKPDKRTTAYKALKAGGAIKDFAAWGERDMSAAVIWVSERAEQSGLKLDKKSAQHLVARVGVDQWQLASAVEKLSFVEAITPDIIDEHIDAQPSGNVFLLFELALEGKRQQLHQLLRTLELTEEPYKLFALLSSQAFQLLAVALDDGTRQPAKDFGIHPYVVSKLSRHAKRVGGDGARRIVRAFAKADTDMKRSRAEPWLLIERALMAVTEK
jgi:DNA polymerase III delta subunit